MSCISNKFIYESLANLNTMKRKKYFDEVNGITFYEKICDMGNLRLAHKNASRGKYTYAEVQEVNKDPDYYLKEIQKMLVNKTYKVSKYIEEIRMENGKERHIYKLPYYPDRIIQWAILQIIRPVIESNFISTTYSSIRTRGPVKCLEKIKEDMYHNPEDTCHCFKFDVRHFYESIDHNILKYRYARLFKDEDLL